MPIAVGALVDDRHRIEGVLGAGAFATVYRGRDITTGRSVAIKVLNGTLASSARARGRFEREIRAVARLDNPHIVKLFTHGRADDQTPFIIFELVEGKDLQEVLKERGRLAPEVAEHILRQVLAALREAHQRGVLHRDLKPGNIRIFEHADDPWRVKVLDFGIARLADAEGEVLTKSGELIGTPRYMSPEQLLSGELSPATDIYSLGILALEMLLGNDAMHGHGLHDQLGRLQTGHLFPVVGDAARLNGVIERMTARDLDQRLSTADAVFAALDAPPPGSIAPAPAPATAPAPAPAAPPPTTTIVPASREGRPVPPPPIEPRVRPGVVAGAGVVVAVLILLAGVLRARSSSEVPTARDGVRSNVSFVIGQQASAPKTVSPAAPVEPADAGSPERPFGSGCGKATSWSGEQRLSVLVPGEIVDRPRPFHVYVPSSYSADKPHPALLVVQSLLFTGADTARASGARALAESDGVVLIWFDKRASDLDSFEQSDVEYVRRAIDAVTEELCVDRARIFAFAHGKGGEFGRALACAGLLDGLATMGDWVTHGSPSCAVPHIKLAGRDDGYAPLAGGTNCLNESGLVSLAETEDQWFELNACQGAAKPWPGAPHDCRVWDCQKSLVSCRYEGGHFWPGFDALPIQPPGCEARPPRFDTLDAAWRFFESLPAVDPSR